jgi:hypothetical protein
MMGTESNISLNISWNPSYKKSWFLSMGTIEQGSRVRVVVQEGLPDQRDNSVSGKGPATFVQEEDVHDTTRSNCHVGSAFSQYSSVEWECSYLQLQQNRSDRRRTLTRQRTRNRRVLSSWRTR